MNIIKEHVSFVICKGRAANFNAEISNVLSSYLTEK